MTERERIDSCYRSVRETDDYAPLHDEAIRSVYEALLAPGDVVIDGGAHSGKHTLPMAEAVGPSGRVFAFEPLTEARARLTDALRSRDMEHVSVSDRALSDVADLTVTYLYFPARPGISGILRREGVPDLEARRRTAVTTTIDASVPPVPVRFMKLDVEGAEMLALAGARETVRRSRPVIQVEAGAPSWRPFGFEAADLAFWCALNSYRCYDLVGNDVTTRRSIEASFGSAGVWDYALVPDESADHRTVLDVLARHRARFVPGAGSPGEERSVR